MSTTLLVPSRSFAARQRCHSRYTEIGLVIGAFVLIVEVLLGSRLGGPLGPDNQADRYMSELKIV